MKSILCLICFFLITACSSKKKKPVEQDIVEPPPVEEVKTPEPMQLPWSYEGPTGPSYWSEIDPTYMTCSKGSQQSPVNLLWKKPVAEGKLMFNYTDSVFSVLNNSRFLEVTVSSGNITNIRGNEYELKSIMIHSPSEHTIGGKSYEMEIQFLHINERGQMAMVSVLVVEGENSIAADKILAHVPTEIGKLEAVTNMKLNPSELLPSLLTHYNYPGSLTTPPCVERVDWNVLNTPIQFSKEQIAIFRTFHKGNNRPIQPMNSRQSVNY